MKTTLKLLLAGIMAVFCGSIGHAQIIYSNNFALGAAINITNTPPTAAFSVAGGTNTATWNDAVGTNNPNPLLANGVQTSALGDSYLLPFTPQTGHVYLLAASLTFTNNPGSWTGIGFSQNDPINTATTTGRFADTAVNGYDFPILTESSGNVQYFAGPHATATIFSANGAFTPGPGTESIQVLLNTETTLWTMACFVNGVQMGTNSVAFASNPSLKGVGITQTSQTVDPTAIQWNYFTLSGTLQPFIVQKPRSQSVSVGGVFSNSVSVFADPNGGTVSYQWYTNGVPLVNSASVSGATSNILIINPVSAANASTNYYCVANNNYGTSTSASAVLTIYVAPVITAESPLFSTNPLTLFGGTNITGTNYVGSSPTFSVTVAGTPPIAYQWLTNGVAVGGATNASFTFTNTPLSGPTNFTCIVSNSFARLTNAWSAGYVPTPLAPYPQQVLASSPYDFWRVNETNGATVGNDYVGGNYGIYTNVNLGQSGYTANNPVNTDPNGTSGQFGQGGLTSYSGQIPGVDFALTNGGNAEFTVEAWANCSSGGGTAGGAPVITKGTYQVSDAFALGVDTNSGTQNYQFYVRNANGTVYKADSAIPAVDFAWHHLVGVCDEANSNLSLYIDGHLAASAYIPPGSGNYEAGAPVSIGAGIKSGSTTYNLQFSGYIEDVATYKHALSSATVAAHYIAAEGFLAAAIAQVPPSTVTADAGGPLVIPATVIGSAPIGYYWTDTAAGTNVAAGAINGEELDATLNVASVPASWNGDQLELTVTNAAGPASSYVSLNVVSGPPQLVTDVNNPFGAQLGGTATNSVSAVGSYPLYYQWQYNGANLTDNGRITGSQSPALSVANAQLADEGAYQVVISNAFGAITSSVAGFLVYNSQPLGFNGNGQGWTVNNVVNVSSIAATNGLLTLTDGGLSEARTFFFNIPQSISAFQASFTYQDVGGGGADGWAFVLQNDARGTAAEGGDGGRVGVGSGGGDTGNSIAPSWELEFDIYTPAGVGYAMETGGAYGPPWLPTGNAGDANYAAETNMMPSGDPINVTLNYANGYMSMVLTDAVAGVSFSTNANIGDLTQIVDGKTAYVGFTAGDGGVGSVQTITNFSFVSFTPMAIQMSGSKALVTWSGSIVGYALQENPDLTTTNWTTVTNVPVITNGFNEVTVPTGGSNLFYRLILP